MDEAVIQIQGAKSERETATVTQEVIDEIVAVDDTEILDYNLPMVITSAWMGDIHDAIARVSWQYPTVTFTITTRYCGTNAMPTRYYYLRGLRQFVPSTFEPLDEEALYFELEDELDEVWLEMMADPHCKCRGSGVVRDGQLPGGGPDNRICYCVREEVRTRGGKLP